MSEEIRKAFESRRGMSLLNDHEFVDGKYIHHFSFSDGGFISSSENELQSLWEEFQAGIDHQQKRIDDAIELIDTFSGMPDSSEDLNQLINQVREALKENKE